jgi:DedD protein
VERRAKERLIGASILVGVLVLIVPELLSGPKPAPPPAAMPLLPRPGSGGAPEPVRTITVDLATRKPTVVDAESAPASAPEAAASAASAASDANAASDASAAGDAGAASAAAASDTGTGAASAVGAPSPASEPTPPPTDSLETRTPSPTSGHAWAVQLGSFANRSNADNLMHQLKSQGFQVYDSATGSGKAQRFRVRIGPLADRVAAERAIARLKALGHAATLVTPGH